MFLGYSDIDASNAAKIVMGETGDVGKTIGIIIGILLFVGAISYMVYYAIKHKYEINKTKAGFRREIGGVHNHHPMNQTLHFSPK